MKSKEKIWVLVVALFLFFSVFLVAALNWDYITQTDFNNGTYFQTIYDTSFIRLINASNEFSNNQLDNSTTGINMTGNVLLLHMNDGTIGNEFPNFQATANNMNMTGNVLLLHLENNANDKSGLGNNGVNSGFSFITNSKLGIYAGNSSSTLTKSMINFSITSTNSLNFSSSFTLCAWINPKETSAIKGIVNRWDARDNTDIFLRVNATISFAFALRCPYCIHIFSSVNLLFSETKFKG